MAAGAVDVTVAAAPDEVWAMVGDFGGVGDFFPGIDSFRLEGDDRMIGMFGMEIRERLLARDDESPRRSPTRSSPGSPSTATRPPSRSSPTATARRSSGPTM